MFKVMTQDSQENLVFWFTNQLIEKSKIVILCHL